MREYIKILNLGLKIINKRIKLNKVLAKQLGESLLFEQQRKVREETEALEEVSKLIYRVIFNIKNNTQKLKGGTKDENSGNIRKL